MSFRKFGTSDEQRASLDRDEDVLAGRTASSADQAGRWTEADQEALLKETREK